MRNAFAAAFLTLAVLTVGCGSTEQDSAPAEQTASTLPVGTVAPVFDQRAHDGTRQSLAELKGRQVVLFFYPRDDTPG